MVDLRVLSCWVAIYLGASIHCSHDLAYGIWPDGCETRKRRSYLKRSGVMRWLVRIDVFCAFWGGNGGFYVYEQNKQADRINEILLSMGLPYEDICFAEV